MAVFIFTNLISGVSGLDKSVVNTANILSDSGIETHILNCVGSDGGFRFISPKFPLNESVHVHSLQAMAVDGGALLHTKASAAIKIKQPNLSATFTQHDLLVLEKLNQILTDDDLIIFTHPLQSHLYQEAINKNVRRVKTMLQIHGNYSEEHENRELMLSSMQSIDSLQIVSRTMRDGIRQISGLDDSRIHYIPNVHFPTKINQVKTKNARLAIIGSLQDRKNQIDAIRALTMVTVPNIHLDIWGNDENVYGRYLKKYVSYLNLNNEVSFRGIGTESDIYRETDIVLITSKHEGFGYTMIEAATHNIPTIAYDYDFGADDFIINGVNGYIVPLGDISALAKKIDELVGNVELRHGFSSRAHERFNAEFSPGHILNLYLDHIPEQTPKYGGDLSNIFVRDGYAPFDSSTVNVKKKKIFGKNVYDIISFRALSDEKFSAVKILTNGKQLPLKLKRNGRDVSIRFPKTSRSFHAIAPKSIVAVKRHDGALSNVLSYTLNGRIERLAELSRKHERTLVSNRKTMENRNGPYFPYDFFETIKKVTDDTGEKIPFETHLISEGGRRAPYIHLKDRATEFDIFYTSGRKQHVSVQENTYKNIYDTIAQMEVNHGFYDFEVGGFRPWELMRASLIEDLMVYHGLWGPHFSKKVAIDHEYFGTKKISEASSAKRLILEFLRKKDIDYRTLGLRTGDDVIVESPQEFGYTVGSYVDGPVYPIHEYHQATKRVSLASDQKYASDFFGPIFEKSFDIKIDFGPMVDARILKFKKEHHFWSGVFQSVSFEEVAIPSAYWSAGICHAGLESGMIVSDIQYALITDLHPTNTNSSQASYTPNRLYAWSDYWASQTKKYSECLILPRHFEKAETKNADQYDFCIISQPRVDRLIRQFVTRLAKQYPTKRIAYCLHPDDKLPDPSSSVALENVIFKLGETAAVLANSEICIGGYSTSLYEAAYIGKPTYVLPVPGWEIVAHGIQEGIFRKLDDISDIVPFTPSNVSHSIFSN